MVRFITQFCTEDQTLSF